MKDYIDKLVSRLIEGDLAAAETIVPCTADEIASIERQYAVVLPASYKLFLSKMGRGAGTFLEGSDFFYEWLPELREMALGSMSRWDIDFSLSKTDFVFLNHGGQFMFFDTAAGDDPPIYHYKPSEHVAKKVSESFSIWLGLRVDEEIELQSSINELARERDDR